MLMKIFYKSIKSVFIMYFLPLLLLIVFFRQFIALFYSNEYFKAAEIFYYLTPYLFYAIFLGVTGQVLDYLGLAKKRAAILTICVLLNFSLNLILIPIYQTIGAAISFSVSYLPYFLGSFYFILKKFQSISENKRKIAN